MGISPDQSNRAFVIDAAAKDATHAKIALYLLRVSADGRSTTLTRLPLVLLPPPGVVRAAGPPGDPAAGQDREPAARITGIAGATWGHHPGGIRTCSRPAGA
jgi:hypothetical protein